MEIRGRGGDEELILAGEMSGVEELEELGETSKCSATAFIDRN